MLLIQTLQIATVLTKSIQINTLNDTAENHFQAIMNIVKCYFVSRALLILLVEIKIAVYGYHRLTFFLYLSMNSVIIIFKKGEATGKMRKKMRSQKIFHLCNLYFKLFKKKKYVYFDILVSKLVYSIQLQCRNIFLNNTKSKSQ